MNITRGTSVEVKLYSGKVVTGMFVRRTPNHTLVVAEGGKQYNMRNITVESVKAL